MYSPGGITLYKYSNIALANLQEPWFYKNILNYRFQLFFLKYLKPHQNVVFCEIFFFLEVLVVLTGYIATRTLIRLLFMIGHVILFSVRALVTFR